MPFDEFVALRREAAAATGAAADGYRGFKETFVELLKRRGVQRQPRRARQAARGRAARAHGRRAPARAGRSRHAAARMRAASPPRDVYIYPRAMMWMTSSRVAARALSLSLSPSPQQLDEFRVRAPEAARRRRRGARRRGRRRDARRGRGRVLADAAHRRARLRARGRAAVGRGARGLRPAHRPRRGARDAAALGAPQRVPDRRGHVPRLRQVQPAAVPAARAHEHLALPARADRARARGGRVSRGRRG